MEPIFKETGRVKGVETLYFADADLQKCKGGQTSFASSGPLHVLYFKDYDRFVLSLNDWRYPLVRRLPVTGMDKTETNSRSYSFPGANGYIYTLRINLVSSDVGLENLETILQSNSRFTWKGEAHHGKTEQSPDDKLVRQQKMKDTGMKEVISETIKKGVQAVKNKVETMKTGTKNLTSRKKMTNLKDIKNKNFKKNAQSKLKKNFFESCEKLSQECAKLRSSNINLILAKSYEDLKKTSDGQAPSLFIPKEEIEECILNNKDLANQGISDLSYAPKSKATEGVRDINKGRIEDRSRNPNPIPGSNLDKLSGYEGMTHHQG
jgi:hypothetical protein